MDDCSGFLVNNAEQIYMKNLYSLIACIIITLTLVQYRISYSDISNDKPLKVTEWDAFGYYAYLPAIFIYHDYKELKWLTAIDKKYAVTGGNGWQAEKQNNGNYVFKYLGGVAIMELPFFLIGDFIAHHTNYPPDGFSPPYQYALGFGVLVYCLLAILLLRSILLNYFKDITVAITLILLCLASNFIQYAAIDNGQSHGYIFPLYVLIIYTTLKWHQKPRISYSIITGYILGLATISRPTEAIMLFIPLLWNTHTPEMAKEKWKQVKANRKHIALAICGGILGIVPQLLYWKSATGSIIYDVGSKWEFLSPHFRVLFGWEKGWFIYTPVTIFFVLGLFFIKKFPFRKSALWFCLLNIYIIIAWHDWRYGGSYSTRALVQGYPVFALPLAAIIDKILQSKWRIAFYAIGFYLTAVNMFQITQYCATIIHYNDMNRLYYTHIYLNPKPTPADISLLDNDELISDEGSYKQEVLLNHPNPDPIQFTGGDNKLIVQIPLPELKLIDTQDTWLKINCKVKAPGCLWQSYLNANIIGKDTVRKARIRLFSPISKDTATNDYCFFMKAPELKGQNNLNLFISSPFQFNGTLYQLEITRLWK